MLIFKENILSLIPQRPPFVMIDQLIYCDGERTRTTFLVEKENILVDNDEFTEAGLVENIAQTAAAGAGYTVKKMDLPVMTGYIGAVKNLEIFALPKPGDLLETDVVIENKIFDVSLIGGSVYCNGVLLATCKMKIFLQTANEN